MFWRKWFKRKELYEKIDRTDVRFKMIRRYIKGKNILDFGFGTGYFIRKLASEGFNVTGIDFSQDMKIRKNKMALFILLKNVKCLKMLKFGWKFNTIICSGVMEYLDKNEIDQVLKFFFRWLDEKGRLIVAVAYKAKTEKFILCPYCLKWFHPCLYKRSFDERNIQELMKEHDFLIEKIRYINVFDYTKLPSFVRGFINFFLPYFSNRGRIFMIVIAKKYRHF